MAIKIKVDENSLCDLGSSKFFGEILLEEKLLKDDTFSPTDIFLCQIDLEDITMLDKANLLPHEGVLQFFIDLDASPVSCKIIYSKDADAYCAFNEESDCGYEVEEPLCIGFDSGDEGCAMLVKDEKVLSGEVCLLRFCPREFDCLDFLFDIEGKVYFIIDSEALGRRDFTQTKVILG